MDLERDIKRATRAGLIATSLALLLLAASAPVYPGWSTTLALAFVLASQPIILVAIAAWASRRECIAQLRETQEDGW